LNFHGASTKLYKRLKSAKNSCVCESTNANGNTRGSNIGRSYKLRFCCEPPNAENVFTKSGFSLSNTHSSALPQTPATNFSSSHCSMNRMS